MNEIDINARFAALCAQRNDALNHCANLAGALAAEQARTADLVRRDQESMQTIARMNVAHRDALAVAISAEREACRQVCLGYSAEIENKIIKRGIEADQEEGERQIAVEKCAELIAARAVAEDEECDEDGSPAEGAL